MPLLTPVRCKAFDLQVQIARFRWPFTNHFLSTFQWPEDIFLKHSQDQKSLWVLSGYPQANAGGLDFFYIEKKNFFSGMYTMPNQQPPSV